MGEQSVRPIGPRQAFGRETSISEGVSGRVGKRYVLPSERWSDRYRAALGWSLLISAVLHAAAFFMWRSGPSGARAGPAEASEAVQTLTFGGALQAVSFSLARPFEIPAPPERADLTDEPLIDLLEIGGALTPTLGTPGLGSADASGSGPARGPGLGGTGARTTSPVPRSLIPEWNPPDEVRGTRVTARVRVDADGHPVGEVQLLTPTPNREFNRALVEKVLRMEYIPAQRDGRPVEAWAEITFVF